MGVLDFILDPVFGPLLKLQPVWAILIISLVVSFIIVIIYRLLTNQKEMKALKDEIKSHQKQMREFKNEPQKVLEIQKKAMQVNMKYMGKSMKPTIITFIPIILIFGWMQAHLAYAPLTPDQPFNVDVLAAKGITSGTVHLDVPEGLSVIGDIERELVEGKTNFTLKGEAGEYDASFTLQNKSVDVSILITNEAAYAPVQQSFKDASIAKVVLGNKTLKVFWKLNWLWSYILFSIVFSIALRKIMKVY